MSGAGAAEIGRRLAAICGPGFSRPSGAADGVAGTPSGWVAAPRTAEKVAEVIRLAVDRNLTVVARGAGSKIDWGVPPSTVDIVLDTGRLAGLRHRPADPDVVEVGAGTPVRITQSLLERSGRRVPIDVRSADATIGGVLASGEAGPLRLAHGTVCDRLVAVTYVTASGALARLDHGALARLDDGVLGGLHDGVPTRVHDVDGDPGVDVSAAADVDPSVDVDPVGLFCGSQGAFGVLVSATLRLQAVPAIRRWVRSPIRSPWELADRIPAILAAVSPAAIEVDLPPTGSTHQGEPTAGTVATLLEGEEPEVSERLAVLRAVAGKETSVSVGPPQWWLRYPFQAGEVALLIEVPVAHLPNAVVALRDVRGVPVAVRGSAGLGVLHAALPADLGPAAVARALDGVRTVLLAREGRCRVVAAPPGLRAVVDTWGDPAELSRLHRLKERFDPERRLAPGRLPGGI